MSAERDEQMDQFVAIISKPLEYPEGTYPYCDGMCVSGWHGVCSYCDGTGQDPDHYYRAHG